MAVTSLYKATASPAHAGPSVFSLRGLFSCCYGRAGRAERQDAEHPLAAGDSADSDEDVREAFEGLQKGHSYRATDSVDLAPSLVSRETEWTPSMDSRPPSSTTRTGASLLESRATRSALEPSLAESAAPANEEDEDSSEHLSEASSVTQYSDEVGEAPQGLTNLSDLSDETRNGQEDANARPTGRVPTLGTLNISVAYEAKKARLKVRVCEAKDIPDPSRGGASSYQLRLVLLPERRQRHKTKLRPATRLVFDELFAFSRVSPSTIAEHALRVRLYGCERMRRERLVAETVVALSTFGLQSDEKFFDVPLEPRTKLKSRKFVTDLEPSGQRGSLASDTGDSAPGTPARQTGGSASDSDSGSSLAGIVPHGNNLPEVLLGLAYNGTTGRLTVEVVKGSAFRLPSLARPPDSYVKINLISANGQEVSRTKTSIRRNDPNPLFKETFMFQMAMFQLVDLTLMVFVYHKRNINRKESMGWFSLGHNSSGEEEATHWRDMREALGERVVRWHLLLEPS